MNPRTRIIPIRTDPLSLSGRVNVKTYDYPQALWLARLDRMIIAGQRAE